MGPHRFSDSDAFALSGGVLTFNEVPDYEDEKPVPDHHRGA